MSDLVKKIEGLSPKRLALLAIELQEKLDQVARDRTEPIAVVGIGCRLPGGAATPDEFWQLLADGKDAVSEVPATRWDIDQYFDPDPDAVGKMASRWGGFLTDVSRFDAPFFGISRREAVSMDPQQRILLETAWEALEHAGQNPHDLVGSATGVFLGLCTSDYHSMLLARGHDAIDAYAATGGAHSVAAGRLSYVLGLHGPNVAIDTACSSSLVAVHLACHSLRTRECRLALAGGANALLAPDITIALSRSHMMAPDGRCKAFDARADGFVRGEGFGIVVLKRLADARQDGDRILALIRGSAVNQDGRSSGITAPNGAAQEAVIRAALASAAVKPADIDYIEAHGTGTSLGDPIEAHALRGALGQERDPQHPLIVGSVKTNLGHLESAAGVTGLIKVVLALQHQRIPPHLHFETLNPHIEWSGFPVEVPVAGRAWPRSGRPRLAGVSSFGFSGTNAHVVLEEAPAEVDAAASSPSRPALLLTASAKSPAALDDVVSRYAGHLAAHAEQTVESVCATANAGRAALSERAAFVATSREGLQTALSANQPIARGRADRAARVAFLFTGQGAQYAGMGRQLYETEPVFRHALDECAAVLQRVLDVPLSALLWGEATSRLESDTTYTQPAMFALQFALARLWRSWGVEPAVVVAHSVGEYAAACVAGMYSLEDGLRLIGARGRLTGGLPKGEGAMAAILAPRALVESTIAARGRDRVSIAAVNGPEHVVVSGTVDAVVEIEQELAGAGYRVERLRVSHAFHSPRMAPIEPAFAAETARLTVNPPTTMLISSVTGTTVNAETLRDHGYWRQQLQGAVQFEAALTTLAQQGCDVFIEIGPGSTLLGLGRPLIGTDDQVWTPSIRRSRTDSEQMTESLAHVWSHGGAINWDGYYSGRRPVKVPVPTYPFERQRYWLDGAVPASDTRRTIAADNGLLGRREPTALPIYSGSLDLDSLPWISGHQVDGQPVVPAAGYIEMALAAARDAFGVTVATIRDLSLTQPLIPARDGMTRTQIVLQGTAGLPVPFEVFGRAPVGAAKADWISHASGMLIDEVALPSVSLDELRSRIQTPSDPSAFYATLAAAGIQLDDACRGMRRLWIAPNEALAEIDVANGGDDRMDPGVLDSCFQVLGAAVVHGGDASRPHVLARIGSFAASATIRGRVTAHAVVSAGPGGVVNGQLTIFDGAGTVIGAAVDVTIAPMAAAAPPDWFYELTWTPGTPLASGASETGAAAVDATLGKRLVEELSTLGRTHGVADYARLRPRLDRAVALYAVRALEALGINIRPGAIIRAADVIERGGVTPRHARLLDRLLAILAEDGHLAPTTGAWTVVNLPPATDRDTDLAALEREFPAYAAEITLTARCGQALAAVLRGQIDPVHLLAPGGDFDTLERLYMESPAARTFNAAAREAFAAALARVPGGQPVRVLEIGAGTGGTTTYLVPARPDDRRVEYVFTDLSPAFIARARERFASAPAMRFEPLDVEQPPAQQGLAPGTFDIVVAANVLHATRDIRQTIRHTRSLLRPGGLLIALEGTRPERWVDVTFGLTEGWWKFDDDLRPHYPLLSVAGWIDLLGAEHFVGATALQPAFDAQQALLLAAADQTTPHVVRVVIAGGRPAVAEAIGARLRSHGAAVIIAPRFEPALVDGTVDHVIALAFDERTDVAPVIACSNTLDAIRALQRTDRDARLWIVTGDAQAIAETDQPAADQAAVWGLARTLVLEHPSGFGAVIDVARSDAAERVADAIAGEILAPDDEDQVAYRNGERLVPRLVRTGSRHAAMALDPEGAYLVTGGFGRLGIRVAEWLAAQGARHIVLTGRRALEPAAASAPDAARRRAATAIDRLKDAGVHIVGVAADIAEPAAVDQLRAALAGLTLRGVVHAAAVFESQVLEDLTAESLQRVLRPKVDGALNLAALAVPNDLSFFVLFSSTTALLGVRTLGAYAAANASVDAIARRLRRLGYPACAVNWGTWDQMDDVSDALQRSYERSGLRPMPTARALAALAVACRSTSAQCVVADIDWGTLRALYEARRRRPIFEQLSDQAPRITTPSRSGRVQDTFQAAVAAVPPAERYDALLEAVRREAASVLGLGVSEVDATAGLFDLGMDSLMSVELKRRLETRCGRTLPSTLTFNYPNVAALAAYLAPQVGVEPVAPARPAPAAATASDDRADMSEDELASLLERALKT